MYKVVMLDGEYRVLTDGELNRQKNPYEVIQKPVELLEAFRYIKSKNDDRQLSRMNDIITYDLLEDIIKVTAQEAYDMASKHSGRPNKDISRQTAMNRVHMLEELRINKVYGSQFI